MIKSLQHPDSKKTKPRIKRKGIVSKKKSSNRKNSKNYKKRYIGQGR